jgi:hypothetical protein
MVILTEKGFTQTISNIKDLNTIQVLNGSKK